MRNLIFSSLKTALTSAALVLRMIFPFSLIKIKILKKSYFVFLSLIPISIMNPPI